MKKSNVQTYPRDESGYLNELELSPHSKKISREELRDIVLHAIKIANQKSSRAILNIPDGLSDAEVSARYKKSGTELYNYFLRYCGDPAATAHQCNKRHYTDVAKEQFRNRTLQKERMNSEWRDQYIAKDGASHSFSYEEIMTVVLDVLSETQQPENSEMPIPEELIESFGAKCRKASLVDENGYFNDPDKLARILCGFSQMNSVES